MAQIRTFGTTSSGQEVQKITLSKGDLTVSLLTWGAVLQSVRLKGVAHDLTLGSDHLSDYETTMRHHGSLIAPVANRIGQARAVIDGREYQFEKNFLDQHCLHGGSAGTQLKVWHLDAATDTEATLSLTLPDGEGGFPGNRHVTARFTLTKAATLRLDITTTTDAPTLWNATNHSYWNLDGTTTWAGHSLHIDAAHWLPTTHEDRPTGEIRPTQGGPMDFTTKRSITPGDPLFDHNFCLSRDAQPMRPVLTLTGQSGVSLTVASTEPGVQVYDGRNAQRPGHGLHEGLAIETQRWPDAPSFADFPPIDLMPGAPLTQSTEWRFTKP